MPILNRDPNLDVCPDFASDPFEPMRALLRNTGLSDEAATTSLKDAWTEHNTRLREQWEREAGDRRAEAEAAAQREHEEREGPQQQPRQQPPAQLPEVDEERPDKEKKMKSKLRAFNPDLSVASVLAPRPSSYALNKLANFEYCELWYFTQEGCDDAQRTHRTEADDSFGMSKIGELVTLRPVASVQASKRALQDNNITWEQFHYAHRSFVRYVLKAGWPDEHAQALVRFFIELENSPYIDREHGKLIVLTYQARVRRSWMDSMKDSDERVFNIALINHDLMESISREILGTMTADLNRQVSTIVHFLPPVFHQLITSTSFLASFPLPPHILPIEMLQTKHATPYHMLHATPATHHNRYTLQPLHASIATRYIRHLPHPLHAPPTPPYIAPATRR
ncbi:hypothetical protein B0H34DRAFT_728648 [Crassisporium funariophilum]|nr:hypothetical protein B0H34DRAFT_728648 [Crassisporium funariophilum]